MLQLAQPSDSKWIFTLTNDKLKVHDFKNGGPHSDLIEEINSFFPSGFVPDQKSKHVLFRFENEDGSYWGGEDVNLMARFDEFWPRPAWITNRAWQLLRNNVNRKNWDDAAYQQALALDGYSGMEIKMEIKTESSLYAILKARNEYYNEGMFLEHGFPVRVIITLG